jgi:2-oxoisovalerate dehydrogenase E2 component (dihydrolipoyl transacylase)
MGEVNFRLPDIGEGLVDATISRWLVAEGQTVEVDTPLVEIETAKATVELPSPAAGKIRQLHGAKDDTLLVGSVLVTIETSSTESVSVNESQTQLPTPTEQSKSDDPQLLVGYGSSTPARSKPRSAVRATPPVRKLARELKIDLDTVHPTGKHGEVTREDLKRQAESDSQGESFALQGTRKHMARAMVRSASEAPQATLFTSVDLTALLELLNELQDKPNFKDLRVTPFALIAFCFAKVIAKSPLANSSLNGDRLTLRDHVNLGIAVATPTGLVVPNIKQVEQLSLASFIRSLTELVQSARGNTLLPHDISGGTTTVTNVGALGVEIGVPLLNPGEAVILAIGAIDRRPWVVGDVIQIRPVVQLALTLDHRILDGSEGAAILTEVDALLGNPGLALMYS